MYIEEFLAKRQAAMEKRAGLILELYKAAPSHDKVAQLMPERWVIMANGSTPHSDVVREIDDVLAHGKNEKLKLEGKFVKAQIGLATKLESGSPDLSALEEFLKHAPKDERARDCFTWPPRS